MVLTSFRQPLARSCYLLVEKRCQTENKKSLLKTGQTNRTVSLWRPPRWSPPAGWRRAPPVGSSCRSAWRTGCTRRERTGPRRLSAWPSNTAPSPTSPSPPSDARSPGEDTTMRDGGEGSRIWNRRTSVGFYMHHQPDTKVTETGKTPWFDPLGPFLRQEWDIKCILI